MRRPALALILLALALGSSAASAAPPRSWAQPQIARVVQAGLMALDAASFRPDDPISPTELGDLIGGLTQQPVTAAYGAGTVTMASLDLRLVTALGLAPAARQFAGGARAAGIPVPARFGSEAVARLLGLRLNHPAAQDDLELLPGDPATRAEAAYSAARILAFRGSEVPAVQNAAATFALPELTSLQKQILKTAFSLVGFPYVWAGTSEGPEAPAGVQARGGFDCSGFVWRVYKLQAYADAPGLGATLKGRTTYQLSGEVPAAQRIALADLEPGDVLFFGAKGPQSKPAQIDHAGIYAGNGWFVHASGQGVALAQLDGWYLDRFAWARRPLAETGLPA
jgi:cell wall-associated NlpC family hydrolase